MSGFEHSSFVSLMVVVYKKYLYHLREIPGCTHGTEESLILHRVGGKEEGGNICWKHVFAGANKQKHCYMNFTFSFLAQHMHDLPYHLEVLLWNIYRLFIFALDPVT